MASGCVLYTRTWFLRKEKSLVRGHRTDSCTSRTEAVGCFFFFSLWLYKHPPTNDVASELCCCREASELRQLLREGEAPKPPKFWSARPGHPDVGDDEEALTEELLLCWRPEQGSPVTKQGRRSFLACVRWRRNDFFFGGEGVPHLTPLQLETLFKD